MSREQSGLARSAHGPSFLRWAGSKRKSLPYLESVYADPGLRYVEPFAGSATVFFALSPKSALLADLNGQLINAMRWVRDRPVALHEAVAAIPRTEAAYYDARTAFNAGSPRGFANAVLFVYLNRNCFNGLWRTNQKGQFNVPYGGKEMGVTPPIELFQRCSDMLAGASIRQQDFRATLARCGQGDLIYADPPYFTATERTFIEYGRRSFGADDLQDLIEALVAAGDRGAKIALSYDASMPLSALPANWATLNFEVTRNVGGFAGTRKKYGEVLYSNFELSDVA